MSRIKSSLELALERTVDVEIDKETIRKNDITTQGKSLAGQFLSNPEDVSLEKLWQGMDRMEAGWMREGVLETLLSNLTLPRYEVHLPRLQTIADGLQAIAGKGSAKKNIAYVMEQCRDLFKQYLKNIDQLEENLRGQWEPRLRKKEEILRQQTGQTINLSPEQDPEFSATLTEQLASLGRQYNEVLTKGKGEIRRQF